MGTTFFGIDDLNAAENESPRISFTDRAFFLPADLEYFTEGYFADFFAAFFFLVVSLSSSLNNRIGFLPSSL
jgi:hypothetical protein